ncbi:MAG: BatA domain-containing protein, partial [Planctomycetes bacterium]|nr:BatA domain-containing protein [Planctomycetota bacterium]
MLNPTVMWTGLALTAVPIIIHLLNRRRFRTMDWAAMQFLWESVRRNRRRLRIEELILLVLRCLAVLLLAFALARFTGCGSALGGSAGSRTVVFILDDSASMGQRVGGGSIFSAAVADLAERLDKLSPADKLAIFRTSDDRAERPFFKLTHLANTDMRTLSGRLASLRPTDERADLARSLAAAAEVFQRDASATRRLYLYGDFRQVDLDGGHKDAVRKAFERLRKLDVKLVAVDLARRPRNNLTVESVALAGKFALAGVPFRVRVEVRNNAPVPARNVPVALKTVFTTAGGLREVELPPEEIALIEPHATARAELEVTCPMPGSAFITAKLPPDELPADSSGYLALDVRDALHVLVVDGQADISDPAAGAAFFLAYAADPDRNGSEGTKVDVIAPAALDQVPLEDYDVVVLANVPELPVALDANGREYWPQLDRLETFVRSGGGLAIFTGEGVNPAFYNGPLYAGGMGLSPLRIGPRKGDPSRRDKYFRLDAKSIAAAGPLTILRKYLAGGL